MMDFDSMPIKPIQRDRFSHEEDMQLKRLVEEHGVNDWDLIASLMPERNARQVRERWSNYLDPNVNLEPWSEEEEDLLIKKHMELGNHWKKIAEFFVNRTDINVKSKYRHLLRMKQKKSRPRYKNRKPTTTIKLTKKAPAVEPQPVKTVDKTPVIEDFGYLELDNLYNIDSFFMESRPESSTFMPVWAQYL